ncbi:hypothetical protein AB8Q55_26580, partial [Klebsiella pneumoniae]
MSENNYGALMMKSALTTADNINNLISPGFYPIPPDNPSSPEVRGGLLTIYPGTVKYRTFTSSSTIVATSKFNNELSLWDEWVIPISRQSLASSDGLKWVGKCKDLSSLRTIEPTISGQSIILERAVIGGPLLNVIITHNPAAADAVDDGYSRFVTAGGAVWDADISFGHNVFLAGYSDELNNLADCLNMIIQDKVNKFISRGYVAGGVDSEIRIPPNPNAENATVFYMNKKSVKIPSFLRVHSAPAAIYDYSDFTTGVGIIGSNEFEGLTNDMMYRNNGGGWGAGAGASNSHNSGGFIGNGCLIKGPNTTSNPNATTYPGVRWGNVTYPGGDQAHFRDTTFSDARVSGWGSGFRPGSVNTYLMDVVACHFTNNTYGIDTYTAWSGSTPQWANSGEKMSFRGCLI